MHINEIYVMTNNIYLLHTNTQYSYIKKISKMKDWKSMYIYIYGASAHVLDVFLSQQNFTSNFLHNINVIKMDLM